MHALAQIRLYGAVATAWSLMPASQQQRVMDTAHTVARLAGMLMLVTAAGIALLLLLTLLQIFFTPESIRLVQLVDNFLAAELPLIAATNNQVVSRLDVDPGLRLLAVTIVAALALFAMASILRALVGTGISLLRFVQQPRD